MPVVVGGEGYTPAGRTQAQIRQDIANYCGLGGLVAAGVDTELIAQVDAAAECAIGRLNTRQWRKWLMLQTIDLVANTSAYDVAELHKDPGRLMRLNTAGKRDGQLEFRELRVILHENPQATASGTPSYYALDYDERQLVLDVPASAAFIVNYPQLAYYYFPRVSMSDNGLGIAPEFDWFVVWHGRMELSAFRAENLQRTLFAEKQADKLWQDLLRGDMETQTDW